MISKAVEAAIAESVGQHTAVTVTATDADFLAVTIECDYCIWSEDDKTMDAWGKTDAGFTWRLHMVTA